MDFLDEKIEEYAFNHTSYEGDLLKRLEEETYEKLEIPQMTTGRVEARFLKLLARLVNLLPVKLIRKLLLLPKDILISVPMVKKLLYWRGRHWIL